MHMKWLFPVCVGASALMLSACGDSGTATTTSVANMESTNYNTLAPTLSTLPPSTTLPGDTPAGTVTTDVTEYTIQSNDVPYTVARKFSVTVDALTLANTDTAGYGAFYAGLKIKIPAGAIIPDPTASPTTTTLAGTPAETTTTLAGGTSNCAAGSYTIVANDLPSTVAKKFDVTVQQLDEANVNTKGYTNFVVGIKIVIPAKAGC